MFQWESENRQPPMANVPLCSIMSHYIVHLHIHFPANEANVIQSIKYYFQGKNHIRWWLAHLCLWS